MITPVQRALRLMDHIAAGGSTAPLAPLARDLGINRVTLSRLLTTFEHEGMIEPAPDGGGHCIAARFLAMAAAALGDRDLVKLARPLLAKLAGEIQLSAHLVVMSGSETVYLLQELPETLLVSNIRAGTRLPAHVTAAGRILLADVPAKQRRELLGRGPLNAVSAQTPTSHAELERLITADATRGCAWSLSGYEAGVNACAAAVHDHQGRVVAAISVAGPESRLDTRRAAATELAVIGTARLLSQMLGWNSDSA